MGLSNIQDYLRKGPEVLLNSRSYASIATVVVPPAIASGALFYYEQPTWGIVAAFVSASGALLRGMYVREYREQSQKNTDMQLLHDRWQKFFTERQTPSHSGGEQKIPEVLEKIVRELQSVLDVRPGTQWTLSQPAVIPYLIQKAVESGIEPPQ